MELSHHLIFLIASVIVALASMFVVLEYMLRVIRTDKQQSRNKLFGALSLALGIWCTQFNSLLSIQFPIPVRFNIVPTVLSLITVIVVSWLVFWFLKQTYQRWLRISTSLLTLVASIVSCHLIAQQTIQFQQHETFSISFLVSALVCVVLVAMSYWVTLTDQYFKPGLGRLKQLISAVLLGMAIVFQHYIAMGDLVFDQQMIHESDFSLSVDQLTVAISFVSVFILMVACKLLLDRPVVSIAGICLLVFGAEFSIGIAAPGIPLLQEGVTLSLLRATVLAFILIPAWKRIYADGQKLSKSRQRAEMVLASIADGVLVTDSKGSIEYLNPVAESLTGWEREKAEGELLTKAFHLWEKQSGRPLKDPIEFCLQENLNDNHTAEAFLRNLDRKATPIEVTASSINTGKKHEGNILVFRDISAKHRATKELNQDIEGRKVLNELLHIRSTEITINQLLNKALDIVTSVSWLNIHRGGIFLMDQRHQQLRLRVHKNFGPENQSLCKKILLGQCLCGLAAQQQTIVFSKSVDERHEIQYPGMSAHGNYNIPIMLENAVLGVIVLYLKDNHTKQQQEAEFLQNFAGALGVLIDLNRKSEKIQKLAYYDKLTNLANRAFLLKHFRQVVAKAKQNKREFAVLFLDLDRFKAINDTLGHHVGDEILIQVARRLESCVRKDDFVARLGGDEFVILLSGSRKPGSSSFVAAEHISNKILDAIRTSFLINDHDLKIGTSIGIAVYPQNGVKLETLLQNADVAMYHAKGQGRNNFQFYSQSMNESLLHRLQLETALHKAAENGHLTIHYQPQVDMLSNKIIGAEALLRWNDPELGVIPPTEFIPIAEESDLIIQLGEWVLEQVCMQVNIWKKYGQDRQIKTVAVNVSLKEIQKQNYAKGVAAILNRHKIDPQIIELEITESVLAEDSAIIHENMMELQTIGVRLALDDFGTGYSSLGRLKDFPVDSIKIDRSFVRHMTMKKSDAAIARAIVAMAHSMKIKVLAEGVETPTQLKHLSKYGCDFFQGFYCAPALKGEEFTKFCIKHDQHVKKVKTVKTA